MNVLDLFAGPGGWDVAAHLLGLDPLGVEWDTAACATAQAAGHRRLQADVAQLDPHTVAGDDVDLLIASPPCQAFSMAGKGKGRKGAQVILDGVDAIGSGRDPRQVCADVDNQLDDPRAALVLEPLRWALDLELTYLAWEQVPAVLPLWEAMADVLRADGWSVATGNLQAEQYDTPQTRKRAILVASRVHEVSLPAAVRRKYRKGISQDGAIKGQEQLAPWLSMADALGWGWTAAPSWTVMTARNRQTGHDVLRGSSWREGKIRELVVSDEWQPRAMAQAGATSTMVDPRPVGSPAGTITGKGTAAWTHGRPATTVQGDPRLPAPGHRCMTADCHPGSAPESMMAKSIRVTVQEAALLQGFDADYPWQGTKTAQYRQVGDAVPPPLAWHVLRAALGMPVEPYPMLVAGSPRNRQEPAA